MSHPRERMRRLRNTKKNEYTLAEAIAAILYGKDWDNHATVIDEMRTSNIRYAGGNDKYYIPRIPGSFMEQLKQLVEINEMKKHFLSWKHRREASRITPPATDEAIKDINRRMGRAQRHGTPKTLMEQVKENFRKEGDIYRDRHLFDAMPVEILPEEGKRP